MHPADLPRSAFTAPHDWIVPDWPVPGRVRAVCTTRTGGVSEGPYDSMNLGDHVADDPVAVQANRALLAQSLAMSSSPAAVPVFMNQVHGTHVQWLGRPEATDPVFEADACITLEAGVACVIMVADCLPVLFANADGSQVAAAHAGWRGLAGQAGAGGDGVLEAVVKAFGGPKGLRAWLGPCIGPTAFEVGPEVRAAFCEPDADAAVFFKPCGGVKFLADLAGLARHRLRRIGVTDIHGNDSAERWCTVENSSRFFSYRRDQRSLGGSGRLAAAIWIDA